MKIISVINQKGGVAKTTTSLAMAAGLIRRGFKVLCIDLDPQCNFSQIFGGETAGRYSSADLLTRRTGAADAIDGNLISASPDLAGMDAVLTSTGREYRLKEALKAVEGYDFVIIDTPPALGILTVNALTASDWVVVPSQADVFSLSGLVQLGSTIETIKAYTNPHLRIAGILLCRFSGRSVLSRDMAYMSEQVAGSLATKLFSTKIRECVSIREAQVRRSDIFTYAPRSNAALDYNAFIDEFLTEVSSNGQ